MSSDLQWLAFRYVSDEMSANEQADFESRLDEDQLAREAVAEAVELIGAVRVVERHSPAEKTRRPRVRTWLAVAACLLVSAGTALWMLVPRKGDETVVAENAAIPANSAVALAWSGLQLSAEGESAASNELIAWIDAPAGASEPDLLTISDDSTLPGWMVEAAALRGGASKRNGQEN